MSANELEYKKYHDKNMAAESRAHRLRNVIGGVAVAVYGGAIAINDIVEKFIPHDTASGIAFGAFVGLTSGVISKQHMTSKRAHESVVRFAAYEVSQSEYEHTTPPDWAMYTLQEENVTAEKVLKPVHS